MGYSLDGCYAQATSPASAYNLSCRDADTGGGRPMFNEKEAQQPVNMFDLVKQEKWSNTRPL